MLKIVEDAAEAHGGLVELARKLGISHQSFYSWRKVPADRVLQFEELTGISRHEIRPDVFGAAPTHGEAA
jgi:DNA-binding transcriptional regulator YdaS (Cro superfamily)